MSSEGLGIGSRAAFVLITIVHGVGSWTINPRDTDLSKRSLVPRWPRGIKHKSHKLVQAARGAGVCLLSHSWAWPPRGCLETGLWSPGEHPPPQDVHINGGRLLCTPPPVDLADAVVHRGSDSCSPESACVWRSADSSGVNVNMTKLLSSGKEASFVINCMWSNCNAIKSSAKAKS